jgi:hypothetical protein
MRLGVDGLSGIGSTTGTGGFALTTLGVEGSESCAVHQLRYDHPHHRSTHWISHFPFQDLLIPFALFACKRWIICICGARLRSRSVHVNLDGRRSILRPRRSAFPSGRFYGFSDGCLRLSRRGGRGWIGNRQLACLAIRERL